MDSNAIYIKNPTLKPEIVEDSIVFLINNKAIVLHEHERNIYDMFNGQDSIGHISEKLNNTFVGYVEKDFFDYVASLVNHKILIRKE